MKGPEILYGYIFETYETLAKAIFAEHKTTTTVCYSGEKL
jgi:hypothetical protein